MISLEKIEELLKSLVRESLSPTEKERKRVSSRYEQIKSFLKGNDIFQVGSYARFTSVTPVHDLDIIWVIPQSLFREKKIDPSGLDLKNILTDLAKKIAQEYKNNGEVVECLPQTHSVSIDFKGREAFSIDLVPAIDSGELNSFKENIYLVPEDDGDKIKWIKSDPKGYIAEATLLNSTDVFRKASKYIKSWKYSYENEETDFPLKSFHLEQIVKLLLSRKPSHSIYSLVLELFSDLERYTERPQIPDKANANELIDKYLDELSKEEREQISKAKALALERFSVIPNCISEQEASAIMEEIVSRDKTPVANPSLSDRLSRVILTFLNPPSWQRDPQWPMSSNFREFDITCKYGGVNKPSDSVFFDNWTLEFFALIPGDISYDEVWWQVVNTGEHAREKSGLRGNFFKGKDISGNELADEKRNFERTEYHGRHWVTAYVIKEGVCIAKSKPFYVRVLNHKYLAGGRGPRRKKRGKR